MKYLLFMMFFSCGTYVSSLHNQIDREQAMNDGSSERNDPYGIYREQGFKRRRQDRRPIMNPLTQQQAAAMAPERNSDILPNVKREYRPLNNRYSSKDLLDSSEEGSLWASTHTSSSLYGSENVKHAGDIVIINVLDNLRSQISVELKRAFQDDAGAAPKKPVAEGTPPPATPEATAAGGAKAPAAGGIEQEIDAKVYDKISGVIVEEISKDYILVRGKKEVFFKKEKRFIEIQALVPRRDVGDNDTVNSDKILESRVFILR